MKIVVVGAGYVGLVQAAGLAELGHAVTCLETSEKRLAQLQRGDCPIFEPGLPALLKKNATRLHFEHPSSATVSAAIVEADAVFLAVGTPSDADGHADLSYLFDAARRVGFALTEMQLGSQPPVVIIKSTVPLGTAQKVTAILEATHETPDDDEWVVLSNPEFLREGMALNDFFAPDRIVVGTPVTFDPFDLIKLLYWPAGASSRTIRECSLLFMSNESAELTKYAANAMLATRISFMNELSQLCGASGADIEDVAEGVGSDRRIGLAFLHAGIGWGGSCFGKDVQALQVTAADHGVTLPIVEAAQRVNQHMRLWPVEQLVTAYGCRQLCGKTVGLWGLAFKPDTDDVRDSPALDVLTRLLGLGCKVIAYDPVARDTAFRALLPADREHVIFFEPLDREVPIPPGVDVLLVCTEWPVFATVAPEVLAAAGIKLVIDGRNLWPPEDMRAAGIEYVCVGRA